MNSGELRVETAGYIPVSEQVRRFERAGESLVNVMSRIYDFGARNEDNDGFADRCVEQYSDNISAFKMLKEEQMEALRQVIINKDVENEITDPYRS